jgi:hypothetical protein
MARHGPSHTSDGARGWPFGPRSTAFLLAALGIGLLERFAFASSPIHTLFASGLLLDDAFYFASFARELAAGHPFQIAPGQPSNGVQPLFALLIAPAWWLGDPDAQETLRVGLVLSSLASIATALLLALWARRLGAGASALAAGALWALSPMTIWHSLNGMETALALCVLTALGAFWPALRARPWLLGVVFGAAVLARFDALLVAPLLALLAARHWLARAGAGAAARRCAAALAGFALVTAPVAFASWRATGFVAPRSGAAVHTLSAAPGQAASAWFPPETIAAHLGEAARRLGLDAIQMLLPVPLPPDALPALIPGWLALLLALPLLAWHARLRPRRAFAPGALCAGLVALYALVYAAHVGAPWASARYLHGAVLLAALTLATAVDLDRLAARRFGPALAWLVLLIYTALAFGKLHVVLSQPAWSAEEDAAYERFLAERVAAGERIGMFQSGRFGYATRGAILNLDGVVNIGAARALADGTHDSYLRSHSIDIVADQEFVLEALVRRRPRSEPLLLEPLRLGAFSAYRVRFADEPRPEERSDPGGAPEPAPKR